MSLDLIRLLFDFGMVVLIWLVQLVIYPGLCYYNDRDVVRWHERYTPSVSYVVMPLMIGQLLVSIFQIYQLQNTYTVISLAIILSLWLSTFIQFVPLHSSISSATDCSQVTQKLVRLNWLRTALWSFLFIWSLYWVAV